MTSVFMAPDAFSEPRKNEKFDGRSQSVETRRQPSYDPTGAKIGDFIVTPSINTGANYTDNVYAVREDKTSDMNYTISPNMSFQSNFIRHAFGGSFGATRGMYKKNTGENFTDYSGQMGGRFDLTGQTSIPINGGYSRQHIRRGTPNEVSGEKPTIYKLITGSTGIVHQGQSLALKLMGTVDKYLYDTTTDQNGTVLNKDRDRTEKSIYTSIGSALEGIIAPFVYTQFKDISYTQKIGDDGLKHSSHEYEVGTGTQITFSEITKSNIHVGYLHRTMDESRFADVDALTYGVNLIWEPSTLASFKLEGERRTNEVGLSNLSASVDSTIQLSMTYELFPNVLLRPSVGYLRGDREGLVESQIDQFNGGLDITYKLNQNLWLSANYKYINQDSSGQTQVNDTYSSNSVGLSLRLQF